MGFACIDPVRGPALAAKTLKPHSSKRVPGIYIYMSRAHFSTYCAHALSYPLMPDSSADAH